MNNLLYLLLFIMWEVSCTLQSGEKEGKLGKRSIIFFPEDPLPAKEQEIPLSVIRRINELGVNDISEFMDDFFEPETNGSSVEIMPRIGLEGVERSAVRSAGLDTCMPELKTVPLVQNSGSSLFYYPQCARVERCGGCCGHAKLACQPVESEILHFSVIVAEYTGGSKLKFKRKEVIGVEQHKKCKCDCKIQPEHCGKYKKYNRDACTCECQNSDDKKKCYEDRQKLWNDDLCTCTCREQLQCGSGFYFDPFECRCEAIRGRRRNFKHTPRNFDFLNTLSAMSPTAEINKMLAVIKMGSRYQRPTLNLNWTLDFLHHNRRHNLNGKALRLLPWPTKKFGRPPTRKLLFEY